MRFCSSFEKARRMFESSSILFPGAGNPECKAPRHVQKRAARQRLQTCIGAPRPEITKVAFLPHGTFDPVRRSYWPLWPEGREHLVGTRWRGAIMRVVTEILSGRRDQFSSVERLIAALAWERLRTNTSCCVVTLSGQAAEMLLLNVSSSWCRRTERTDNDSSNASLLAIFA